ncbi:MAG: hypothetical protein IJ422_00610 [Oscillospiraceae bacterium]|nr:hypothetical protein [Oscillospiraceae bacterium]
MILSISRDERLNRLFTRQVIAVYIIVFMIVHILPTLKYNIPYIVMGLFALLPVVIMCVENAVMCRVLVIVAFAGLIKGILAATLGNAPMAEVVNEPIRGLRYFVPCLLLIWTLDMPRGYRQVIWWIITGLLLVIAVRTLIAVEINPMIARELASGEASSELIGYRNQNIGGFEFCYAVCILFAMCMYLAMKAKKAVRIMAIAAVIFIAYFTIQVQYMTMLLLCIAAFILVVVHCAQNRASKVLAVFFSAFLLFALPPLLRWLAELDLGDQIYKKLINVASVLDGTREMDEATSRARLYWNAFVDFASSPIWGVPNSVAAQDSHSTFLGTAASTGLIGLAAYSYGIVQSYKQTLKTMTENQTRTGIYTVTFVTFLILAFVNPVHYAYEISIMLLYYIPLTLILV